MDEKLFYEGKVTIEELLLLYELGFEFVIEGGAITDVIHP